MNQLEKEDLQWVQTEDGSFTPRRIQGNVLYKSSHGARTESQQIFINGAHLSSLAQDSWTILELGFGAGMNFHNCMLKATIEQKSLHYIAVDHLPLPPQYTRCEITKHVLSEARRTGAVVEYSFGSHILTLYPHPWQNLKTICAADAVFHDPFAPNTNPECWTKSCFEWEAQNLKSSGILTTYSAAGHIRRALAKAGFFVAIGPGVGRKRETTRASRKLVKLSSYKIKYRPRQEFAASETSDALQKEEPHFPNGDPFPQP
ncbi:MAG: MnmC family methyltransferase [Myxococcota bacterium]|nr:MnmC family methyltransferase [Myxococcota bacterium]